MVYDCACCCCSQFGPRETTSHKEIGGVYPKYLPERDEAFNAFAPRALKLNTLLQQGGVNPFEAVGPAGSTYLAQAAAAAERKREPFAPRSDAGGGGWPSPAGQPWDQREQMGLVTSKPWDATKRTVAEMRAMRGEQADDPLLPLWW